MELVYASYVGYCVSDFLLLIDGLSQFVTLSLSESSTGSKLSENLAGEVMMEHICLTVMGLPPFCCSHVLINLLAFLYTCYILIVECC